ncbi:helix-turn-helix domain-containing protein [Anaerocolumna chitinilytica]|uniref:HTH cro/C1-type domain-containing protein n=1 Tax=Anaerocolumna chitinilytica TaxID=1727145 RepID=A0A7I8DJF9_9FIRM|nr:helix-turn-helix transcriptional regulator [Anaerocolumna chitinilytica]BCJ98462.1 hypothetical protein bsdcttw_15030 [Anaerocolumna chitinilytica]
MHRRIRNLRIHLKLTQKQFADKLGVSHAYISKIENRKTPITNNFLVNLADTFNIDIAQLKNETPSISESSENISITVKNSIINFLESVDDQLFNSLVYDLTKLISVINPQESLYHKLTSYKNELEAEKRGLIFIALQDIKGIRSCDLKVRLAFLPNKNINATYKTVLIS